MTSPRRVSLGLITLALAAASLAYPGTAVGASAVCADSYPSAGVTVTVCLSAPASGALLTGPATVSASVSVSNGKPVKSVVFSLDGSGPSSYVLSDFAAPFTFVLPTSRWADGAHSIGVKAVIATSPIFTTPVVSEPVTFATGGPVDTPTDFVPRVGTSPASGEPVIVAAVGDGADGGVKAASVTSMIQGWNPNLFLYLGDVYDRGSYAELTNWYGSGDRFSTFSSITDPTIGNHEYATGTADGYFSYWGHPPHYYSVDVGGWHLISLDSTTNYLQAQPGTAQYDWLANDLSTNGSACTMVFFHHPTWSNARYGARHGGLGAPWMSDVWSLLASKGVDIVLNGHDHNYQRWRPLGPTGSPDPAGPTEFVVGTGGHSTTALVALDQGRMAAQSDTVSAGALRLALSPDHADFSFQSAPGLVQDSGSVACSPAADNLAPTKPTGLSATPIGSARVDLTWTASTDLSGIDRYEIRRDGVLIGTVPGSTTAYSDLTVSPSTTYQYTVRALDPSGNASDPSDPAQATTETSSDVVRPVSPPGLTARAAGADAIYLSWDPSSDDVGVTGYEVVRDGVPLASLSATAFDDTGLTPATSYTYTVIARDLVGNHSDPSSVAGRTVSFADGFETGDTSNWANAIGVTVGHDPAHVGGWALQAQASGSGFRYVQNTLPTPLTDIYVSTWVNVSSRSSAVDLLRLRHADGSGIVRALLNSSGKLVIKNDFARRTYSTPTIWQNGTWHRLVLHVGIAGASSTIEVSVDDAGVFSRTKSLGTNPIGRLVVGDTAGHRTYSVSFDDVMVDTAPIS